MAYVSVLGDPCSNWDDEKERQIGGGAVFSSSRKIPKFSTSVDSFPWRNVFQGLSKFRRAQAKRGGEENPQLLACIHIFFAFHQSRGINPTFHSEVQRM